LTNLRFADDLLLLGTSLKDVEKMLQELALEASIAGLSLHPSKTKILSNISKRNGRSARDRIELDFGAVEILHIDTNTEYLGRLLGFRAFHDEEIDHRIAKGWGKFHKFKAELCCKSYPLKERLKLFDSIITPSVLYGSGCWTMTRAREKQLQSAQRRMLRLICQPGRRKVTIDDGSVVDESWVEWVQRATHFAEEAMKTTGVEAWVPAQRRKKWRWAGHVARMTDERWTVLSLAWEPAKGRRNVGRPRLRWADCLDQFFASHWDFAPGAWQLCAMSREDWNTLENDFCYCDNE
jgi:hypothetical protein